MKCPNCGIGRIFKRFLKISDQCGHCHEELHYHRADDAPPYFTIMIVGHIIIPLVLYLEMTYRPELWIHLSLWLPLTIALAILFLPPVKGALVALQWALYMHGFNPEDRVQEGNESG